MISEKEININKSSELMQYFKNLEKYIKDVSIVKVCTLSNDCPNDQGEYSIDQEVNIIFKNQTLLTIDYNNIDNLFIQYRKMTTGEIEKFAKVDYKDMFNRTDEINDYKTLMLDRRNTYFLKYGSIQDIRIEQFSKDYGVWVDNTIHKRKSTSETFCKFSLILDNGNEISFEPEDAINDGYMIVKSKNVEIHQQIF